MLISLCHSKVEAGVSFDAGPCTKLSYLTNCWMVSLQQFCADCESSIWCKHNRLPSLARVHDSCRMDKAFQLPFTKQVLTDVNIVCIYIQVQR